MSTLVLFVKRCHFEVIHPASPIKQITLCYVCRHGMFHGSLLLLYLFFNVLFWHLLKYAFKNEVCDLDRKAKRVNFFDIPLSIAVI